MSSIRDSPRVRRIVAAFVVNRLGTFLGLIALLVVVYDHTHNALAISALLLAWQALPAFAVPPLVARVESSRRGLELSGLYFFEAVTTAAIALLVGHFWLPGLLFLAALDGTAALASGALLRAALAKAAREESGEVPATDGAETTVSETTESAAEEAERQANAALNIGFSISFVLGPALGGVIVAAAGPATALFVDVGSFLVCGVLLLDVRSHVEEAGGDSVRARLASAWQYVSAHATLRSLLMLYTVALALFQTAAPIEVAFAKSTLQAGDRGLGLLLTAWGAGAVAGSLMFARVKRWPLGVLLSIGTLAIGLADLGFAAAPTLAVACAVALVGGLGNGLELPSLMSLVQQLSPSNMHGRVIGAVESLTAFSLAVGLVLGGLLVTLTSTRVAFVVVGALTVAIGLALVLLTRPRALSPERAEAEYPMPPSPAAPRRAKSSAGS